MVDENYQLKQLYERFGEPLFYNPAYWYTYDGLPSEVKIAEEKTNLEWPDYELELISDNRFEMLRIHKELYLNRIPDYPRWWDFCRLFTDREFDATDLNDVLWCRKEFRDIALALGGDKIYYLDDQSDVLEGLGQGQEYAYSWREFEKLVAQTSFPLMLDIPRFLTDAMYRNDFLELKAFPYSFFDNFSDLK